MKHFIKTHQPPLSYTWICNKIQWHITSFSQWMKGDRKIPKDKEDKLRELLEGLGFKEEKK